MKNLSIVSFILYFIIQDLSAQSGGAKKCIDAEPLCGSTLFSYPNTSGINFVDNYANYGCLTVPVNPAWFYFQISNDGDIQLKISQATKLNGISDLDVDFVAYGPFDNPHDPCKSDLQEPNIVDCSFKTDFVEYLDILNAKAGDYYILLITNFSTKAGFITVEQTKGKATTNCNLLQQPEVKNYTSCSGNTLTLDATTVNASHYEWYEEKSDKKGNYELIQHVSSSILEVEGSKSYKVKIYDCNRVFLKEMQFNITFYLTPEVPETISDYVICLENDNYRGVFDLRSKDNEILNGLDPDDFVVSYFNDENAAHSGLNPLPYSYANVLPVEMIYVRIENKHSSELHCYDVGSFLLLADSYPKTDLEDSYILCTNANGTESVETPLVIETYLDENQYNFKWYLNDVLLVNENKGFIVPNQGGRYAVNVTRKITTCASFFEMQVIASSPPKVETTVVSNPFTESNTLEVTVKSDWARLDYLYRLDDGNWQENNRFYDVSLGEHAITVLDMLGCGETTNKVMVMDYPLFFTPNGDGFHDTWNIVGIPNNWYAKVNIFDRYGRLIKTIIPNNPGWDGTVNGNALPSDDYWFSIEYKEPEKNSIKTFKAHFTLKR